MTVRNFLNLDTHPSLVVTDGYNSARLGRDLEENTHLVSMDRADFEYDYIEVVTRLLDAPVEGIKIRGYDLELQVAYDLDPWEE